MISHLSGLLKLAGCIAFALVLTDAIVFRSGAYAYCIKFNSTAGSTVNAIMAIRHFHDPERKNILVLGNSQVGEGFSAAIADGAVDRDDLHFVNGAIAGTTPRVWNYLLREVDPDANRYAAIAMPVDYDGMLWNSAVADNALDTAYLSLLLRLSDLWVYPASFPDRTQRERARRAILLPMQALREDLLDLILHPGERIEQIRAGRDAWMNAVARYPGRSGELPDLPIEPSSRMPSDWGPDAATFKPILEPYFRRLGAPNDAAIRASNIQYEHDWLRRIAARYRANGVPVILFSVPRGPWHGSIAPAPQPNRALIDLNRDGSIQLIPGDAFVQFEQPRFFFDTLHMNHTGREAFSALLAQKIAPLLH